MNVNKTPVNNAANLSMFMVNVSAKLLAPLRLEHPEASILDLKARYRGLKYLRETLKILPQKPDTIVIDNLAEHLGGHWCYSLHFTSNQTRIIGEGIDKRYQLNNIIGIPSIIHVYSLIVNPKIR